MATNASPLGIFQTALGTMPRPLNLSEQLANYNLTQSQAAEAQARVPQIQSLTQAQQLENQKTQIQLGLDQQARTLAKQYQQTVPTTPPPANFPAPAISGYDDEGNPQYAATPDWHAAAAQASAPAGHFDFDGYAAALMKAGDIDRALSVSKTAQELRQKNADTAKKEMDNFEAVRSLKADVTTPIVQALDKGDVAGAQDLWNGIDAETLNRMGVPPGTAFNPDAIRNQNKMALGYEGATKQIKDNLGMAETRAKTEAETAAAEHARAAAKQAEVETQFKQMDLNWVTQQAAKAEQSPDDMRAVVAQFVDPKKHPQEYEDAVRNYAGIMTAFPPTQRRAEGTKLLMGIAQGIRQQEMDIEKKRTEATDPAIVNAEVNLATRKAGAEATARTQAEIAAINTGAGENPVAKQTAEYKLAPPSARNLTTAPGQAFLKQVLAINPDYRQENYAVFQDTEKKFATGKEASLVRSNNNVLEHLGLLYDAGKALNNGDLPLLNKITNRLGYQAGGDAKATYDLIAHVVGDEFNKALVPGGGGQGERREQAAHFSSDLNDTQRSNNIRAALGILNAQQNNLADQYKQGTFGHGERKLFTDEAMTTRNRLLSAQPASYAQTATNPQGHKIGSNDGGKTWVDVQTGQPVK